MVLAAFLVDYQLPAEDLIVHVLPYEGANLGPRSLRLTTLKPFSARIRQTRYHSVLQSSCPCSSDSK